MKAYLFKQLFDRAKEKELGIWIRFSHGFEIILATKKPEHPYQINFMPVISVEARSLDEDTVVVTYAEDESYDEIMFETENIVTVTSADIDGRHNDLVAWQKQYAKDNLDVKKSTTEGFQ